MDAICMVTWLAPGLPLAFFERVREVLEAELKLSVSLESRTKLSGPDFGSPDPFAEGNAELGFLCAPAAVPRDVRLQGGFELLHLAPVFDDARTNGAPQCYCDLVVRADTPGTGLDDLVGLTFGYNDRSSLSGWLGICEALKARHTQPEDFFGALVHTGGHLASLQQLRAQGIEVAAIDSNVLRTHPGALEGLRIIDSVGPWPSQPVVVRRSLDPQMKARIKAALGTCGPWAEWGFVGFGHQEAAQLNMVPSAATTKAPGLSIRSIDASSESEIALIASRMRDTLVDVLGQDKGQAMYSMEWLKERVHWHLGLGDDAGVFVVQGFDGAIVGHGIVRLEQADAVTFGYFSTIYVAPQARRQGVATAMIEHVNAWCAERDLPFVIYNTAVDNDRLIRLYARHGYEIIERAGQMVKLKKPLGS